MFGGNANPQAMMEAGKQLRQESDAGLAQILDAKQKERFDQIVLQNEGPLAVARPEIAAKLRLNESQKEYVQGVMMHMRNEFFMSVRQGADDGLVQPESDARVDDPAPQGGRQGDQQGHRPQAAENLQQHARRTLRPHEARGRDGDRRSRLGPGRRCREAGRDREGRRCREAGRVPQSKDAPPAAATDRAARRNPAPLRPESLRVPGLARTPERLPFGAAAREPIQRRRWISGQGVEARILWISGMGLVGGTPAKRGACQGVSCPNTVLLPHLGSASIATRAAMSRMAAENVLAMLQDRRPPNLVNPEVWASAGPVQTPASIAHLGITSGLSTPGISPMLF